MTHKSVCLSLALISMINLRTEEELSWKLKAFSSATPGRLPPGGMMAEEKSLYEIIPVFINVWIIHKGNGDI